MNVLETEWWTLAVPPEWWAESEDDCILVGDRDGVGCIQVSTLHREFGSFSEEEVAAIAAENAGTGDLSAVSLGDFSGVYGSSEEGDTALREWFVASGSLLLYVTYTCDGENRGMDDAAVDELLDTLALLPVG